MMIVQFLQIFKSNSTSEKLNNFRHCGLDSQSPNLLTHGFAPLKIETSRPTKLKLITRHQANRFKNSKL